MPPKNPALLGVARAVQPEVLREYAERLGWVSVPIKRDDIVLYHHPTITIRQAIIPIIPSYDDYGELVQEAVDRLATFEGRSFEEVLVELSKRPVPVAS